MDVKLAVNMLQEEVFERNNSVIEIEWYIEEIYDIEDYVTNDEFNENEYLEESIYKQYFKSLKELVQR